MEEGMATPPAPAEFLRRGENLGSFIFICSRFTMHESLKRQIFGLPYSQRDSVRAIRPGTPLFLYNFSSGLLHGIFEATSYPGTFIDPSSWPDNSIPGRPPYPVQVRVRWWLRRLPLPDPMFRPLLAHYDGTNKFHLRLTVNETRDILELFDANWRVSETIARLGLDVILPSS